MSLPHFLRPLLLPRSVALVGASERAGSLGRVVLDNLLAGGFTGALYAVNPRHRSVLGVTSHASLQAIGAPVDLVLVTTPCAATPGVLADAARIGTRAAVVMSAPPEDPVQARAWQRTLVDAARAHRLMLVGPHAFGIVRTDLGLDATVSVARARRGRLALVAQSSAVCTAMIDFAGPIGIGFSTVFAAAAGTGVWLGDVLDALLLDTETDAILLHVETIVDARRLVSALRAAARTKPVVVLKTGRWREAQASPTLGRAPPSHDAVFDAAMRRSGTVRAHTYTQLFAAARLLALRRQAQGDRLAIVTNGHGPGTLAADRARDRGVPLATLAPSTLQALAAVLPAGIAPGNPLNVRGDADAMRLASAVKATLDDPGVDAVLALHVRRPHTGPVEAARAVAEVAREARKPVLGAWLGAIDRRDAHDALEAGGIPNFYTPENAVDAFSFVAAYRRHQRWLLEVPASQPEPAPVDLATVDDVRREIAARASDRLSPSQTHRLLAAFGLPAPAAREIATCDEARAAAREVGYPVRLMRLARDRGTTPSPRGEGGLRDGRILARACERLEVPRTTPGGDGTGFAIVHDAPLPDAWNVAIEVRTDPVFGPVIVFGECTGGAFEHPGTVLLPPLNRRLIDELLAEGAGQGRAPRHALPESVAKVLLQVSSLVCAVPWIGTLVLDPVRVGHDTVAIARADALVDRARLANGAIADYRHMAIHPYPAELAGEVTLRDGTHLHVRPIVPEDAAREQAFVAGLSGETRYYRFFYRLHELTPQMLARFTQVDYDRELALVALVGEGDARAFVGVARFVTQPDRQSAEFAVVVDDAWQGRGVGTLLMQRLIASARHHGLRRLEGAVLRTNRDMLRFVEALGFAVRDDPTDPEQALVTLPLA